MRGGAACIVGGGAKEQLLLRGLTPLVVIMAMPLVGAIIALANRLLKTMLRINDRRTASARESDTANRGQSVTICDTVTSGALGWLPASLIVAFCFTPAVSSSTFRAWYCLSFTYDDLEDHSFLAQDLSVRCDGSPEHKDILTVAWILVAIWPIGMVVGYAALLIPCHYLLSGEMDDSDLLHATRFLHRDYRPQYYWWEVVSLLQRTTLTGWLLLVEMDLQFIRLLMALNVSIFFLVAVLVYAMRDRTRGHKAAFCSTYPPSLAFDP